MRRLISFSFLLLFLASTSTGFGQGAVHTNKTRFRIPYRYDAQEMTRLRAQEIRLYTSIDQGQRWQLAQTVPPKAGKFQFQAPADGEYWFAVRTLDGNNNLHPGGNFFTPGLKVIVDTTKPKLELTLKQASPGKVGLTWTATDQFLDVDDFTLEYVQAGAEDWQAIRIVPAETGETSWTVPDGGIVAVRGTIKDKAGNEGTAQMQISVDPVGAAVPQPAKPDFRRPVASSEDEIESNALAKSFPEQSPASSFSPSPHPFMPNAGKPVPTPRLADDAFVDDELSWQTKGVPVADEKSNRPEALQGRYPTEEPKVPTRPAGPIRIVKQTTFELEYQLNNVGPSGIATVELFITQDEGKRWWRYGEDDDDSSPFVVKVPIEGTYGFAMRVKSGAGLTEDPPKNGEAPEMSVIVDQTPPAAEILAIKPITGPKGSQVQIRWRITEPNPSGAPVSLSYSENPQGPWTPITGWQADEGEFLWNVKEGVPANVFIKLDARDAAGNVTSIMNEQPLAIDSARPSARIVDVEAGIENGVRQ